jgi:DNA-binding GntR family transcriptional regulator
MSLSLKPLTDRPDNLTDMVLDALKEAIIDKTLEPGRRLSEAELAESLNVSKTPVREALLRLRYIGLVVPGDRGVRVIMPSTTTIRYAYEVRAGIERTAASLAAERASDDDVERITTLAKDSLKCARAGDGDGFRRHDLAFHTTITQAARNPMLAASHGDTLILTRALRERDVPRAGDSVICATEHTVIAQAIADRDGETAGRAVYDHIGHVMRIVLGTMASRTAKASGASPA